MSAALRQWLETLGLAQYGDRFAADDIDLDVLPSLSEQDLAQLGVSMGHRKRLLKAIAELTGASASSAPPTTTAATTNAAQPRAGTADARKVVTVVFADLAGSTSLHEQLDAESVTRLMERYYATMRAAVEAHGGTVVKLLGDGVMAAFGVPRVAEDDAIRAVRAGVAMQDAFRDFARRELATVGDVGLRVGVNTGEVVVAADDTDIVGDPVNVAARLQAEAGDGHVVIGEATRRLVASLVTLTPLGRFALKGRAESITAYRVESLERPVGVAAAAFVGRDDELARLLAVYEAACTAPAARLAVLLGSPGLGKSRLIEELGRRLGDAASVVTAHCDATGGATFAPIAAALRDLFQIETGASTTDVQVTIEGAIPASDTERGRIAAGIAALLADSPASPEETFFLIRRLLAGLAAAKPVVLVIDDLHWAEPLLLDLVEHLVQWGSGTPLLVLVGARPELRDLRSSLVTPGGPVADVVTLGGLDAGAAMRLAANVIGAADLPATVAAKVLATSEGNPLFVGELVRMLVDEGAIKRQGERWVVGANLAALEMPPTIHALLAARIERLEPDDRAVLERAAVVGRHFSRSAVAALLGRNGTRLDARLEALRRTELIERDTGWFLGEPVLRFHHVLIRDAAYRRLLKGTRAELHEQLADWIEAQVGDAPEHDETIGWHLEQAHQHRRELGPLDANGRALGERAARRLAAAGRRALARDDAPVASGLLGRALERLAADDPTRAELALDWCEALLASGDVTTAERAIAELGRFAVDPASARDPRLAAWHACFRGQLTVLTAPQALHDTADGVAAAAGELAKLGDAAGEAKGHFVHALALARLGRIGGCEAALDKALAAARRAGDRRRANTVLAIAPLAALWGPSPVTRASGRCLDVVRVLRITQGAPAVEAVALSCQAVLEALRGRADAARRMIAAARKMVEDLGLTQRLLETDVFSGLIDLLEGDAAGAERGLRGAYHGLRDLGLGIDAARAAALLARALLAQDRAQEADTLSHESEALAGDDLKAAIAWRGVRAEALARRGEHAAAVELAQAAVEIAAATDALLDHADARLALAAALRAAGRGRDADAEERRAIELWEAKGAALLVERTRRAEARGAATATPSKPRTAPAPRRRVTPNHATAALVPFNAAMAAPDFASFREQMSEAYEEIDHPTGVSYGRDANVAAFERLMRSRDARCRLEPLATLGDALVLSRRTIRASATGGGRFDVGAYEQEAYTIAELDDCGRWCRHEVFAADRLHDARVRLFQRHAELLPAGRDRTYAAAAARSLDVFRRAETDPDILPAALAPDFEGVDHRHLSSHTLRGAAAYVEHLRAWRQVADDVVFREYDVLTLAPRATLVATLHTGTARSGGGAYERPFLTLFLLDAGGRLARAEWFDADRETEALARFDELVAGTAPPGAVRRRVTPNAATASAERFGAAVAARDLDALSGTLCAEVETLHHQTGVTYARKGFLATWRSMFRAETMIRRQETIAGLGDALALAHHTIRLEGFTEEHIAAVGAVDIDEVVLFEVDESGRTRRFDIFPAGKLGSAVSRLYQRHAELLREGPERVRAAATAASFAVLQDASYDPERLARALAPDFESVDHRHLSGWTLRGADGYLAHLRALREVADDVEFRHLDVIALSPSVQLVRVLHTGTARAGGGRYERPFLRLFVADADGRIARAEWFDADHEAEALARFDAIVASNVPKPAVRRRMTPNAATAWRASMDAAIAACDSEAIAARMHAEWWEIDHRTGSRYGKSGGVASAERLFRSRDPYYEVERLATLGARFLLIRRRTGASGDTRGRYDVGPYEDEAIELNEVDPNGLFLSNEVFATDHLGDALVRLYERHAELLPEGPEHERAAATARSVAVWNRAVDLERIAATTAPAMECVDHRSLNLWSARGADEFLVQWRGQLDLATGSVRHDDVLATAPDALLVRQTFYGTDRATEGFFDHPLIALIAFGSDGLLTRVELWEPERDVVALARFDELVAGMEPQRAVRRRVTPNAGSAAMTRVDTALAAGDFDAFAAEIGPDFLEISHPNGVTYGREAMLRSVERFLRLPGATTRHELLATLGDRLWLLRRWMGARAAGRTNFDVGEYEKEEIGVHEVDEKGRALRNETFGADRLGDALVRFYERHAESLPEGGERTRAAGIACALTAFNGLIDLDRLRKAYAPSCANIDHRVFGTWSASDAEEMVRHFRLQLDLAPNFSGRYDEIFAATDHAVVARMTFLGTARDSGGRFENPICVVFSFGVDGRVTHGDIFETEQVGAALARYDELTGTSSAQGSPFENAATRLADRFVRATAARDWQRLAELFAADLVFDDRRPLLRMALPREGFLEQFRVLFDVPNARWTATVLATRGERLALFRLILRGDVGNDGGPLEIDHLWVGGVGADERCDTIVLFEPDDLEAAWAEIDARYVAREGAQHPHVTAVVTGQRRPYQDRDWQVFAFAELAASGAAPAGARVKLTAAAMAFERLVQHMDTQDWDAVRAACAHGFAWQDRRPIVGMAGDVDLMIASARERMASGARHERREIVAAAGDRLAIARILWAGGPTDGRFEVEFLALFEIDADELLTALIFFEPNDLRAAQREAWARWAAIDPSVTELTANLGAVIDAWNAKDVDRLRALIAEDLVAEDRRLTGIGRSEGREAYLRSVAALWELAPDSRLEAGWHWLAHAPHGGVYACRRSGTLPGGGEFVADFIVTVVVERALLTRLEVFETDAADAALARFEALRPDPLRIPPTR